MSFLGSDSKKLALIIGINYTGKNGELRGCITDTQKIINMLKTRCGYNDSQIILLTDETPIKPTKTNILNLGCCRKTFRTLKNGTIYSRH